MRRCSTSIPKKMVQDGSRVVELRLVEYFASYSCRISAKDIREMCECMGLCFVGLLGCLFLQGGHVWQKNGS